MWNSILTAIIKGIDSPWTVPTLFTIALVVLYSKTVMINSILKRHDKDIADNKEDHKNLTSMIEKLGDSINTFTETVTEWRLEFNSLKVFNERLRTVDNENKWEKIRAAAKQNYNISRSRLIEWVKKNISQDYIDQVESMDLFEDIISQGKRIYVEEHKNTGIVLADPESELAESIDQMVLDRLITNMQPVAKCLKEKGVGSMEWEYRMNAVIEESKDMWVGLFNKRVQQHG